MSKNPKEEVKTVSSSQNLSSDSSLSSDLLSSDISLSFDFSKDIDFRPGSILSRVVSQTDKYEVTLMCMAKGTSINTHISIRQGFIFTLKGKGVFTLFNEQIEMKPDVLIIMPPNAPHSLRADDDTAFLLILTK